MSKDGLAEEVGVLIRGAPRRPLIEDSRGDAIVDIVRIRQRKKTTVRWKIWSS